MVNEVEVENVNAEPGKEYVYTIEHEINDVNLSQGGCVEREDELVMIDSGASVNVRPKWFGNSKLEQSDGATCLRGANGKPLQEYGKRQIWLKICGQTKRYDFHVVNVTKPILSVSCLCEQGVETHLAKKSFSSFGDGHEPLIRKGGVYFVKAQTVNACVRADGCSEKTREHNLTVDQKNHDYKPTGSQKTREYNLMGDQKNHDYKPTGSQKTCEYNLMSTSRWVHKTYESTNQKNHVYKPRKCKIRASKTVHVSECGGMMELKSFTTIREVVRVKMLT